MRLFIYAILLLAFASCKSESKTEIPSETRKHTLELKYANGSLVNDNGDHKIISILKPWPESNKSYKYGSNKVTIQHKHQKVI